MKYISKGDWFKKGTEVKCIDLYTSDGYNAGLFKGIRICDSPKSENKKLGEEYIDEEFCSIDEFDIYE